MHAYVYRIYVPCLVAMEILNMIHDLSCQRRPHKQLQINLSGQLQGQPTGGAAMQYMATPAYRDTGVYRPSMCANCVYMR